MAAVEGKTKWSALHVRNTFIEYFKTNGHIFGKNSDGLGFEGCSRRELVPSSSVVPLSDPTLLFGEYLSTEYLWFV